MKIKRKRGLRVPGIRNRLNGDDNWGLYALMDWYCQGHLTQDDVLARLRKYALHLAKLVKAAREGRYDKNHQIQIKRAEYKTRVLMGVLETWDKRNFS